MKKIITFFLLQFFAFWAYNQTGSLDPSFGNGGIAVENFGHSISRVTAVANQVDGKLIVVGSYKDANQSDQQMVARFLSDGQPDLDFGDTGIADIELVGIANDVVVQPDGKILAVGSTGNPNAFQAVRLLDDGSVDTFFGEDGVANINFGNSLAFGYSVALLPDGKIVMSGRIIVDINNYRPLIVQLFPDGSPDSTFSGNGKFIFPDQEFTRSFPETMEIQSDGKIMLGGWRESFAGGPLSAWAMWRVLPDGSVDADFGINGMVVTEINNNATAEEINSIVTLDNGQIIIVGTYNFGGTHSAIARYLPNGSLDPTFGQNGIIEYEFSPFGDRLLDVLVQPDQKILAVGGLLEAGFGYQILLLRLMPDGSPDASFGTNGVVIEGGANNEFAWAHLMQPDDKIVVAGSFQSNVLLARFFSGLEVVSTEEINAADPWSVFPNPCREWLTIRQSAAFGKRPFKVRIFENSGRMLLSKELLGESTLSFESFPAGLYFVKIEDEQGIIVSKRVVKVE